MLRETNRIAKRETSLQQLLAMNERRRPEVIIVQVQEIENVIEDFDTSASRFLRMKIAASARWSIRFRPE